MKYICVHHTAVANNGYPQLDAVNRYHRDKDWGGGWKQPAPSSLGWYVGYNEFVDVDGTRTKTRVFGEQTIAVRGHNCDVKKRCDTYHVCFAGGNEPLNSRQLATWLKIKNEFPEIEIVGHRHLQNNRTCPGDEILNQVTANEDAEKEAMIRQLQFRLLDLLLQKIRVLKQKIYDRDNQ